MDQILVINGGFNLNHLYFSFIWDEPLATLADRAKLPDKPHTLSTTLPRRTQGLSCTVPETLTLTVLRPASSGTAAPSAALADMDRAISA